MHDLPHTESSGTLRELIHAKRTRGQMAEAIVLARLGARIVSQEHIAGKHDEVSRIALERYLELMPDDAEVRQALQQLPRGALPPRARPPLRRLLLWAVFILGGVSTAGAIHLNGLPLDEPVPVSAPVMIVRLPPVVRAAAPSAEIPVVIRAVGDVVLGSNFPVYRLPGDSDKKRIASLRNALRNADIVVGNLEGVLYDHGTSRKDPSKAGLFSFRMPESYAVTLREMGFDVMSLANNHSMDFGAAGLEATLRALRGQGIQPVGVPGAEVASVRVRNTTVAFLNYSYLPAFARLDDVERIGAEVRHARAAADMVIVTVHGGKEGVAAAGAPSGDEYFMHEYRGDILKFSHLAIDAGASAVFGHGPHVVRPYEIYRDKPIFFSLGNFVGYRSLSTRGKLAHSIIAEVRFTPQGKLLGAGVIPLKLDRSGIPQADYSATNLDGLDGLLDEQLDKRPVLRLAARLPAEGAPQAQAAAAKPAMADAAQSIQTR